MPRVLTLDAGTSSVKCSLVDDGGALLYARTEEYPVFYPKPGYAEQRPDDILSAVTRAVKALPDTSDIACIGLTGTMNGCIPLDSEGRALYSCIIHLDTRATGQAERLEAEIGGKYELYRRTGNRPDVHYGLPKLMWLKENEPDVYIKARVCVNTKDLIYGFLTGIHNRSDYSDASLFGAMNIHSLKWDEDVISAAGIDGNKLPELFPSGDVSGRLSPSAAKLLGLASGIPVAVGCGDGPATTHGSGVYDTQGAYLTVGSSAWAAALCETPCIDPAMRAFHYTDIDPRYTTVCGTVQCASTALDYMLKTALSVTKPDGSIDFDEAERLCFSSPAGAKGLLFMPTLMGERCPWWDPDLRGTLFGLTLSHTRADMVRAVYEGIAQELNNCVRVLRESGMPVQSLILSGGGMKGNVYRSLFPDVFGCETRVHLNPREATSLGAAMAAGVGAGVWKDYRQASKLVKLSAPMQPDETRRRVYELQAPVFAGLYAKIADAMHDVCALGNELGR